MPNVIANYGIRLHYEEKGQNRPLVSTHGWTFSGRFFVRNVGALTATLRGNYHEPLRSHGDSDWRRSPQTRSGT